MFKNYSIILLSLFLCSCSSNSAFTTPVSTSAGTAQASSGESHKYFKELAKYNIWRVEMTARNWDMSSKLSKISAREIERDGRAYWAYFYKSPFKRNALMVIPDGGAFELREPLFNNEIRERDIRIDSDQAVKIAQEKGLNSFPIINMNLDTIHNYPEWELETKQGFFLINAIDGSIKQGTDSENAK